ncbi:unnamed protein product [Dicrocoelium dendriticum]|nr:unnamed protein product [Dicrocoelium dendriticum]
MGVRGLWHILDPVQEYRPLPELSGETVAVDLSIWVCGDMSIKYNLSVAKKLYLRNLFFRTLNLLRLNVLPVIVTDGIAPKLKALTLTNRHCEKKHLSNPSVLVQRRRFSSISGECCALLDALGVPWIQSPGEAEAMCALLNSSKDASVRVYRSGRVETDLQLTRYHLVLLSILLGCDYWPSGATGVGKAGVMRLIRSMDSLEQAELVHLVSFLKTRRPCTECDFLEFPFFRTLDAKTLRLWVKTGVSLQECPIDEIFIEYLSTPECRGWDLLVPSTLAVWRRPNPRALVSLCRDQLAWDPDYTLRQLLPVLALWDMRHPRLLTSVTSPSFESLADDAITLIPIRIIRKRTVNFVPSYEVEWKRLGFDVWTRKTVLSSKKVASDTDQSCIGELVDAYAFPVPIVEFQRVHPRLCEQFETETQLSRMKTLKKSVNKFPKKPNRATCVNESNLLSLMSQLRLSPPPNLTPKTLQSRLPKWDSSSDSDASPPQKHTQIVTTPPAANMPCARSALAPAFRFSSAVLSTASHSSDMKRLQSSLVSPSSVLNTSKEGDKENMIVPSVQQQQSLTHDEDPFDIFVTPPLLKERLARLQQTS